MLKGIPAFCHNERKKCKGKFNGLCEWFLFSGWWQGGKEGREGGREMAGDVERRIKGVEGRKEWMKVEGDVERGKELMVVVVGVKE